MNSRNKLWKIFLHLFLFRIDPEKVHRIAIYWAKKRSIYIQKQQNLKTKTEKKTNKKNKIKGKDLSFKIGSLELRNPLGLASGLDKNGDAPFYWANLGFGFVEIGTVTPLPQLGNSKPRLFRLIKDKALINRMGFNNQGMEKISRRLNYFLQAKTIKKDFLLGVNLGKNRDIPIENAHDDYIKLIRKFIGIADYFVINISSPNTPNLQKLHQEKYLTVFLDALKKTKLITKIPFFLKLAPDLKINELIQASQLAKKTGFQGIIMGNTTVKRKNLKFPQDKFAGEIGGLSGFPLQEKNLKCVKLIHKALPGFPIIGTGGISCFQDMKQYLLNGAQAVQLFTGLIYQGPKLPKIIIQDLINDMEKEGAGNFPDYLLSIRKNH